MEISIWLMILFLLSSRVLGEIFVLEAEDAIFDKGKLLNIMKRSDASNGRSVSVKRGDKFHFEFCLMLESDVDILDLRYSNDGRWDLISISIDSVLIGKIETKNVWMNGQGWNKYRSSDERMKSMNLLPGRHRLTVQVLTSDIYGVEIDMIKIKTGLDQGDFEFKCMVYCFENIKYESPRLKENVTTQMRVVQQSVLTKCAEEDNVNMPIFGPGVNEFSITTTLPQYKSFNNSRGPDFTDCEQVNFLWRFEHLLFSPSDEGRIRSYKSGNNFRSAFLTIEAKSKSLHISFTLYGNSRGVIDSEIGSVIHLRLGYGSKDVKVLMQYMNRYDIWSELEERSFSTHNRDGYWEIPDLSWKDGGENQIKIFFETEDENDVQIEFIEMKKRYRRLTYAFHMYNDGKHLVEGADIDFWWQVNRSMTVRIVESGKTFYSADYFRIYHRVPWAKDLFSQVFVIYQDGNIRVLPVSPHGLDWIPFGSSVLIGQSDPMSERPAAPISHIDLEVKELTLKIKYADGGSIFLKIVPTVSETRIIASRLNFRRDRNMFPFATFRSMWVADGNADVDHMSINGSDPVHIMSKFQELQGYSLAFFRRCISKHNTLSPDIQLHVLA